MSLHIVSYRIVPYRIASHPIASHRIESHIVMYRIVSHRIISYRIASYHIISYHISYHIISYIIPYHTISYNISYITSHRITSHHITSHHIISYHITSIPYIMYLKDIRTYGAICKDWQPMKLYHSLDTIYLNNWWTTERCNSWDHADWCADFKTCYAYWFITLEILTVCDRMKTRVLIFDLWQLISYTFQPGT